MDKQMYVIHLYNGILLYNKKEQSTNNTCYNMDESQWHHAEWKKPDTKDRILYNFIHMEEIGKFI